MKSHKLHREDRRVLLEMADGWTLVVGHGFHRPQCTMVRGNHRRDLVRVAMCRLRDRGYIAYGDRVADNITCHLTASGLMQVRLLRSMEPIGKHEAVVVYPAAGTFDSP